jgi:hypothetical protein
VNKWGRFPLIHLSFRVSRSIQRFHPLWTGIVKIGSLAQKVIGRNIFSLHNDSNRHSYIGNMTPVASQYGRPQGLFKLRSDTLDAAFMVNLKKGSRESALDHLSCQLPLESTSRKWGPPSAKNRSETH